MTNPVNRPAMAFELDTTPSTRVASNGAARQMPEAAAFAVPDLSQIPMPH
ncbi:MAG: hypothetical protein R3E68_02415 [Burkholderiaceae bacterium]